MMWSRSELKERAKRVVNQHYWWLVLACIILSVVGGGGGSINIPSGISDESNYSTSRDDNYYDDYYSDEYYDDDYDRDNSDLNSIVPVVGTIIGVAVGIFFVIFAIALVVSIFVFMPLKVGIYRFFMHARENRRDFSDVSFVFGCGQYLNVVKIMFLVSLKTFLWSLLFVIPGVVKSYEYRMIPYILSENPGIDSKRAFEMTKAMTDGEKGNIWVLDLSFFGWELLSCLTCYILSVFWLNPYKQSTYAELYTTLRENALQNGKVSSGELYEYYSATNMNAYGSYNQNGYGQTVYDQNTYGQNGYNQNGYNQNTYGQNGYSQNSYNQNTYGQNSFYQDGYNQNNYGQNDYNKNSYSENNYGQNGYDQNDYNQNRYAQTETDQSGYNGNGIQQSDFNQINDNTEDVSNDRYN